MRPEILERIDELVDTIANLKNKSIKVYISISRARDLGHDRHFSTETCFKMLVNNFGITMSGAQIILEQDETTCLGVSADALADFSIADDGKIIFIEHFEEKTERRTVIIPIANNEEPKTKKS
jgi:hypothetical protein